MLKEILYVSNIVENTIVDGEGFRTSLYLSGCNICCEDCHNKDIWDINTGIPMEINDVYNKIINEFTNITFIGGEPMMQAPILKILAKKVKENTTKNIWIYSGHTFEEIMKNTEYFQLLSYCDVLVDGKYDKKLKGNLKFKGSSNQRIIDIKKSMSENRIVLWEDHFDFHLTQQESKLQ